MILDPSGFPVQRWATMPPGDLRLSDGRALKLNGPFQNGGFWKTSNGLRVFASTDQTGHGELLHVSISYASRDPSWADIRAVRDAFYPPDLDVMMVLPQARDYINLHQHTFHLWQTPTQWGVR